MPYISRALRYNILGQGKSPYILHISKITFILCEGAILTDCEIDCESVAPIHNVNRCEPHVNRILRNELENVAYFSILVSSCFTHQVDYLFQQERHLDGQSLRIHLPGTNLGIIVHYVFIQFGFARKCTCKYIFGNKLSRLSVKTRNSKRVC